LFKLVKEVDKFPEIQNLAYKNLIEKVNMEDLRVCVIGKPGTYKK